RWATAWPGLSPLLQSAVIEAWLSRESWALDLLKRVEAGVVLPSALQPAQRDRLARHVSKAVREGAKRVFAGTSTANRAEVIARYEPVLKQSGDPKKGAEIYRAICAACHRRGNDGRDLGPDLASVASHSPEKLLGNILDPNGDIQPGYQGYTVTLRGGEQLYGLIGAETANSLTMKLVDGSERVVLRDQVEVLRGTNVSLMPEGLEAAIDATQMADLIAFLRGPL
ncbi:MAG: c-type cytochrome, partial [Verrucomicrobiae bacterium]|nr:c-type cytochrome [Verrucomicrobiae bacterium]